MPFTWISSFSISAFDNLLNRSKLKALDWVRVARSNMADVLAFDKPTAWSFLCPSFNITFASTLLLQVVINLLLMVAAALVAIIWEIIEWVKVSKWEYLGFVKPISHRGESLTTALKVGSVLSSCFMICFICNSLLILLGILDSNLFLIPVAFLTPTTPSTTLST